MNLIKTINGDLLEATDTIICHQINCRSRGTAGIAAKIFKKFPWANNYDSPRTPGFFYLRGNGKDQRFVIGIAGQIMPGLPSKDIKSLDSKWNREDYFIQALSYMKEMIYNWKDNPEFPPLESIAFPYKIGCGLGGGDWSVYSTLLQRFAHDISIPVNIYKL